MSRHIPDPVARAVRQRCGFGCVICGKPIYQYEHKLGFAKVQRHVAEEITLLCGTHHDERTRGLRTAEQVEEADRNPYNRGRGATEPYALAFGGSTPPVIWMGGITFTWKDRSKPWLWPFCIYGYRPFGVTLDEGGLLLNVHVAPPNVIVVNRWHGPVAGGVVDVQGDLLNMSGGELPSLTDIGFTRCRMEANIGLLIGGEPVPGLVVAMRVNDPPARR